MNPALKLPRGCPGCLYAMVTGFVLFMLTHTLFHTCGTPRKHGVVAATESYTRGMSSDPLGIACTADHSITGFLHNVTTGIITQWSITVLHSRLPLMCIRTFCSILSPLAFLYICTGTLLCWLASPIGLCDWASMQLFEAWNPSSVFKWFSVWWWCDNISLQLSRKTPASRPSFQLVVGFAASLNHAQAD